MNFKTEEIKTQFHIGKLDFRLSFILYSLDNYIKMNYNYDITVTEIWRAERHPGDVHTVWRAADIRTYDMPDSIKQAACDYLSHVFYTGDKSTFIIHDTGLGLHFHIQVDSDSDTMISNNLEK